jgi:Putative transposase
VGRAAAHPRPAHGALPDHLHHPRRVAPAVPSGSAAVPEAPLPGRGPEPPRGGTGPPQGRDRLRRRAPHQPVFKGKLLAKLRDAVEAKELPLPQDEARDLIARAGHKAWGIRIEPPLDGPDHVVEYLSRYVHRIAISNSRIIRYDGHTVVFRYKDRQDGGKTKPETLSADKFSRLFLQHVLPDRFVRIRHYGLLASRRRKDLERCRRQLGGPQPPKLPKQSWDVTFRRLFGKDPLLCPRCQIGRLVVLDVLPPLRM